MDHQRDNRPILFRTYLPAERSKRLPLVVFSHGSGGRRDGNEMLGQHLASHGIIALHLQHEGSDIDALRKKPRLASKFADDFDLAVDRCRDIAFVVAKLDAEQPDEEWIRRVDPKRLGMSGHSFGAITSQIIAGQLVRDHDQELALPSFRGAFILSPSPPRPTYGKIEKPFANMQVPILFVTGTKDVGPKGGFATRDRRIPFDQSHSVDRYLLVLNDANHYTTAGLETMPRLIKWRTGAANDPRASQNLAMIRVAALAFWRSILLEDAAATAFLQQGSFAELANGQGTYEWKPAERSPR